MNGSPVVQLHQDLTTLAFCWRVVRRDGVALGFTSHDQSFTMDGLLYRAEPGISPSAVSRSDRLDADTMEVSGVLRSDAIAEADLDAGRYDGARVEFFLTSWEQPQAAPVVLASGFLGKITRRDSDFTAELRGDASLLEKVPVELFSPECRTELGDKRCRVDLAKYTSLARLTGGGGDTLSHNAPLKPDDYYAYGQLTFIQGPNAGSTYQIRSSQGDQVTLFDSLLYEPDGGELVQLRAGCDKRFETCVIKFNNSLNFRGEPHVPGNDLLLRYGGL